MHFADENLEPIASRGLNAFVDHFTVAMKRSTSPNTGSKNTKTGCKSGAQLIETAPRDGGFLILEEDTSGKNDIARWASEAGGWVRENGEPIEISTAAECILAVATVSGGAASDRDVMMSLANCCSGHAEDSSAPVLDTNPTAAASRGQFASQCGDTVAFLQPRLAGSDRESRKTISRTGGALWFDRGAARSRGGRLIEISRRGIVVAGDIVDLLAAMFLSAAVLLGLSAARARCAAGRNRT